MEWRSLAPIHWVDLRRTDAAVIEIDRAGKPVKIGATSAPDFDGSDHPIISAGVVVETAFSKVDVHAPKAIVGALADFILAYAYRSLGGEACRGRRGILHAAEPSSTESEVNYANVIGRGRKINSARSASL